MFSGPVCWAENDKDTVAQTTFDSSEKTETILPAVETNTIVDSHSTVLVYEGEDQDLVCFEENVSNNAKTLWLKVNFLLYRLFNEIINKNSNYFSQNGRPFEAEVEDFINTEKFVPTIRSTLIIRAIQLPDNGVYTCIIFDETAKPSVKTFDLLVTAEKRGEIGALMNQSGITAIIVVMTALIILMAIATALSYRLFCNTRDKNVTETKPSKTFQFTPWFVLDTEVQKRKSNIQFPIV